MAHTLKGVAASLGLDSVASAAARLNSLLRDPDRAPAPEACEAELSAIDAGLAALGETLGPTANEAARA